MYSKLNNITGIILRKRIFTENDLIVTILTKDGHRHDLIVKGARTAKSRRKGHLELMNLVEGTVYQSKIKKYLQSVQCKSSFSKLKENVDTVLRMHLILEIIEKTILENDPHPEIFQLLHETLQGLNEEDPYPYTPEVALVKLAHFLGFFPSFKDCASCHKSITGDSAHWDPGDGTLLCHNCANEFHRPMPLKYRKALEFFRRAPRSEFKKVSLYSEESNVLREFLPSLFTAHMDKPLKSLSVF